jgi:hypothetical protein
MLSDPLNCDFGRLDAEAGPIPQTQELQEKQGVITEAQVSQKNQPAK